MSQTVAPTIGGPNPTPATVEMSGFATTQTDTGSAGNPDESETAPVSGGDSETAPVSDGDSDPPSAAAPGSATQSETAPSDGQDGGGIDGENDNQGDGRGALDTAPAPKSIGGLTSGAIAGIATGVAAALSVTCGLVIFVCFFRTGSDDKEDVGNTYYDSSSIKSVSAPELERESDVIEMSDNIYGQLDVKPTDNEYSLAPSLESQSGQYEQLHLSERASEPSTMMSSSQYGAGPAASGQYDRVEAGTMRDEVELSDSS